MKPENLAAIKKAAMPIWQGLAGDLYPEGLLDRVLRHRDEYRKNTKKQ